MNPLKYRPDDPEYKDWDDNAVSNAMAWLSDTLIPWACGSETHWTARFADKLWTSCPCCLLFRGACLGMLFAVVMGALLFCIFH